MVAENIKDLSCFLEEFGKADIQSVNYENHAATIKSSESEVVDDATKITFKDFDGNIGNDVKEGTGLDKVTLEQYEQENVRQSLAPEETTPVVVTEEQLSNGFDQACLRASNVMDKANSTISKVGTRIKIATNRALSTINSTKNLHNFQKGNLVIAGDFVFLQFKNQLMLLKYKGNDSEVIVPDEVGGLPVTLICDTAFKKGRFVAISKLKNFIGAMKSDDVSLFTIDSLRYAVQGIHKIQLPVHLRYLPNYVFSHCTSLKAIEIPAEVVNIAPNAFKRCKIEHLALSNVCTKNMIYVYLPDKLDIYIHNKVLDSYEGVLL